MKVYIFYLYLLSFEVWCWRRMEKSRWIDGAKNEELLHRVKEGGNFLLAIKRRKLGLVTTCI